MSMMIALLVVLALVLVLGMSSIIITNRALVAVAVISLAFIM